MAERFKFSLEKLLEIRIAKEEECKRLFTESQRQKIKVEENLEELKRNLDKYSGIAPNEDVVYQKLKRYYVQGIQSGIKSTEKNLTIISEDVDKKRKDLITKQMERKTVETLKNKKYVSHIKEQNRLEQINIDELALYAYVRNQLT
ncbi:flagellar export protein FliJ [Clostridium sp.]|uniref:flagellar export protein FliJ n=1 Tax=Clostridium sp. TaxID=1506 RepID=UPI00261FB97D|nr:flagellar export protein FliJ [Clostridium sp.]